MDLEKSILPGYEQLTKKSTRSKLVDEYIWRLLTLATMILLFFCWDLTCRDEMQGAPQLRDIKWLSLIHI